MSTDKEETREDEEERREGSGEVWDVNCDKVFCWVLRFAAAGGCCAL